MQTWIHKNRIVLTTLSHSVDNSTVPLWNHHVRNHLWTSGRSMWWRQVPLLFYFYFPPKWKLVDILIQEKENYNEKKSFSGWSHRYLGKKKPLVATPFKNEDTWILAFFVYATHPYLFSLSWYQLGQTLECAVCTTFVLTEMSDRSPWKLFISINNNKNSWIKAYEKYVNWFF